MKEKQLRTESIRILVTKVEKLKLEAYARRNERTLSQVIRDYIKRLPVYDNQ